MSTVFRHVRFPAPCSRLFYVLAILYWDYLLTLKVEINTYWKARPSRAAWLYFLNRGLGLLGHLPVIVMFYFVWDRTVSIVFYAAFEHRAHYCFQT